MTNYKHHFALCDLFLYQLSLHGCVLLTVSIPSLYPLQSVAQLSFVLVPPPILVWMSIIFWQRPSVFIRPPFTVHQLLYEEALCSCGT